LTVKKIIFAAFILFSANIFAQNTYTYSSGGWTADIADIASNMTTANSKIIAIDMYTGFDDSMLADEVHYNEKGAEFIANRYYGELKELLVR